MAKFDKQVMVAEAVGAHAQYQSDEAAKAAAAASISVDESDGAEVGYASITDKMHKPVVAERVEDPNKHIMITPRKTIARTKIGLEWYSFIAGRKVLVPRHVARLLDERNLI